MDTLTVTHGCYSDAWTLARVGDETWLWTQCPQPRNATKGSQISAQPHNVTVANMQTTQRLIRYDKEHSRTERRYRVFKNLPCQHKCSVCGDVFNSRSWESRFCSERCRNDKHIADRKKARQRRRASVRAACSCGVLLVVGTTGRLPRHCSPACRQRAYRAGKSG